MPDRCRHHRGTRRSPIAGLILLLVLGVLCAVPAVGQDTSGFYQDLERVASKHRFTRWVHGTIFVRPERQEEPPAPGTPQRRTNPLLGYAGRHVRMVEVRVLDPFGFDLLDSTAIPTVWVQRAGNSLHRTTREYLVREFVLVKKGEAFDPLEAVESERLLRATPMVNDARIFVTPVHGGTDTVDVHVLVLDKWSLEAWLDIAGEAGRVTVVDRNLLGLGQEVQVQPTFTPDQGLERLDARHAVYNIKGTYISSLVDYAVTDLSERLGARLDRPFFSPLTKWAGAASVAWAWTRIPITNADGSTVREDRIEPFDVDTWIGRSFPLAPGRTNAARSSAIVAGTRYMRTRYAARPAIDSTGIQAYPQSDIVLVGLGLSVRQYYRERYLYRFGAVEDVPEGLLVKLTTGLRYRELTSRTGYTGLEVSRGRHYHGFGYASVALGVGTFWQGGQSLDARYRAELRYFTDLFRMGRWYLRQFVSISGASITRQLPTERMDLNGDILYGFRSAQVSGTHRELLKLETVAYAPWRVLGFRFAPVLLAGFATIGREADPLFSGRIHSAFGLGILVRNENLLVKTFEVSLSFYPYVPEEDGWVLDVGRYTDFTARLADFAFTQPAVVGY